MISRVGVVVVYCKATSIVIGISRLEAIDVCVGLY